MYEYDPRTRTDEGILRLCKEIKEKWSGTMTPPQQYGLNDAWNKINQAEVGGCSRHIAFSRRKCLIKSSWFRSVISKKGTFVLDSTVLLMPGCEYIGYLSLHSDQL